MSVIVDAAEEEGQLLVQQGRGRQSHSQQVQIHFSSSGTNSYCSTKAANCPEPGSVLMIGRVPVVLQLSWALMDGDHQSFEAH